MSPRLALVFSAVFVCVGVALVVQTARVGGGIGYLLGVLFIALGIGRGYLSLSKKSGR